VLATQHTVHDVVGSFQYVAIDVVRLPTKSVAASYDRIPAVKPILIATLQPVDESAQTGGATAGGGDGAKKKNATGERTDDEWLYVLDRGGNTAFAAHNAEFANLLDAATAAPDKPLQIEASQSDAETPDAKTSEPQFVTTAKETLRNFKECLSAQGLAAYVGRGEAQLMSAFASVASHD